MLLRKEGGTLIETLKLDSGSILLDANAFLRADGFLSALNLDLELKDNDGDRVTLDLAQSQLSLADGNLRVRYDAMDRDGWRAKLIARDLRSPDYSAGLVDGHRRGHRHQPAGPDDPRRHVRARRSDLRDRLQQRRADRGARPARHDQGFRREDG